LISQKVWANGGKEFSIETRKCRVSNPTPPNLEKERAFIPFRKSEFIPRRGDKRKGKKWQILQRGGSQKKRAHVGPI